MAAPSGEAAEARVEAGGGPLPAPRHPLIETVGHGLLVVGPVAECDGAEALSLVERTGLGVRLERVQREVVLAGGHRGREQAAAYSPALKARKYVQMLNLISGQGEEPDQPRLLSDHPHPAGGEHDVAHPLVGFLIAVQLR